MKVICNPWISSTLLNLIKQKNLYLKFYRRGIQTQKKENTTMKNKINNEMSKAKKILKLYLQKI